MYNSKGKRAWLFCVSTAGACRFGDVFVDQFSNSQLSFEIPGHPWDVKGLQKQKGVGLLVGIQERRALMVSVMTCG